MKTASVGAYKNFLKWDFGATLCLVIKGTKVNASMTRKYFSETGNNTLLFLGSLLYCPT